MVTEVFFVIGLSLKELISSALDRNPEIKSAEQRYFAGTYTQYYGSSLPPMSFGMGLRAGVDAETATGGRVIPEFEIMQKIPYPLKLSKLRNVLRVKADILKAEFEITRLRIINEIKQKYFELWALYAERDVLNYMKHILYDLKRASEIRYGVGKEILQAVLRVDVELSRTEERIISINARIKELEARINELVGGDTLIPFGRPEDDLTPIFISLGTDELFALAEENSPIIYLYSADVLFSEGSLELAKLSYYPDFSISVNNMMGKPAFFVSVDIPVWFRQDQANRVREARSLLLASRNSLESAKLKVISDIKSYVELANSSFELWKLYRERILPQARASFESARSAWIAGVEGVDFTRVIESFLVLLMYEIEEKRQIALNRKYVAELERIVGLELNGKQVFNMVEKSFWDGGDLK